MEKFRVGIVGCGTIFPMHAYPVSDGEHTILAAVCDNKEERAKMAAKNFNCYYYTDYKEMIDKGDISVVHICAPHYLHAPIALYALSKGKHVLTEKPMSISYSQAKEMAETAKVNDVILGVIMQNRYNPGSILIKETLESGELGKVLGAKLFVVWKRNKEYYSESDWKGTWEKEGGGVIINQALHTFDLMRWFIDDKIKFIDANISKRLHDFIEVEDTAEGVIGFENGVRGLFYVTNAYSYGSPVEIELHCENGMAHMVADSARIRFSDGRELKADQDPNERFGYGGKVQSYWGVSHIKQIRSFYESLSKGEAHEITVDEALKTHEMICAIYNSGKTSKRVEL